LEKSAAQKEGAKPLARVGRLRARGVEPSADGPRTDPGGERVFEKAGLKPADMDVIESNEAFASSDGGDARCRSSIGEGQSQGGAVALGHPIGAPAVSSPVKAIYELPPHGQALRPGHDVHRRGQGIAAIFERM